MSDETNNLHNGRQRLRPWLIGEINQGKIKGLVWMNQDKTMFKIPWKHAGKQDYDPEEDSKIFKRWSENTGKYKKGVNPEEPAVWKTRLRTALNKLPDIQEVTDKTMLDIPEPYRVYRLLPKAAKNARDGARPTRPKSGSENNNYYYNFDAHRQNGYFSNALPYHAMSNTAGWPQQAAVAPKQYSGQGYYHDDRLRQHVYAPEGYPHGMQQQLPRDPTELSAVLDVISADEDSRNMMQPHTIGAGGPQYLHGNNNDPNQADQYHPYAGGFPPSNQDYYPTFTATPAQTGGYFPDVQYPFVSQTNPQGAMQQPQCPAFNDGSDAMMTDITADCLPAEHEFEVLVFYRSTKVVSKHIANNAGCHIYYNKSNNNHLGSEVIVLPSQSVVDSITDKHADLTKSILDASEGGLTLQVKNRHIYVTRFCRSALFWSSSLHPSNVERVERFTETAVFDLDEFSDRVKNYVCSQRESPASPAVYFGVAQNWTISSPLKNCLISIVVRPLRSVEQLRTMNNDAKSLPLSVHSGLLQFSGVSMDRESFEEYQELLADNYTFDPVAMAEEVFIQSEGDSPSP